MFWDEERTRQAPGELDEAGGREAVPARVRPVERNRPLRAFASRDAHLAFPGSAWSWTSAAASADPLARLVAVMSIQSRGFRGSALVAHGVVETRLGATPSVVQRAASISERISMRMRWYKFRT